MKGKIILIILTYFLLTACQKNKIALTDLAFHQGESKSFVKMWLYNDTSFIFVDHQSVNYGHYSKNGDTIMLQGVDDLKTIDYKTTNSKVNINSLLRERGCDINDSSTQLKIIINLKDKNGQSLVSNRFYFLSQKGARQFTSYSNRNSCVGNSSVFVSKDFIEDGFQLIDSVTGYISKKFNKEMFDSNYITIQFNKGFEYFSEPSPLKVITYPFYNSVKIVKEKTGYVIVNSKRNNISVVNLNSISITKKEINHLKQIVKQIEKHDKEALLAQIYR